MDRGREGSPLIAVQCCIQVRSLILIGIYTFISLSMNLVGVLKIVLYWKQNAYGEN